MSLHCYRQVPTTRLATPISAVTYDLFEELIWSGNENGRVVSHLASSMDLYSAFKAHASSPVQQLLSLEAGVLSLGGDTVQLRHRRGLVKWTVRPENTMSLLSMSYSSSATELLVAGSPCQIHTISLIRGAVVKSSKVEDDIVKMKRGKLAACGALSGKIYLKDPRSLRTEHVLDAHTGTLADLDVSGNTLITCGFAATYVDTFPRSVLESRVSNQLKENSLQQRKGGMQIEPMVKVYDIRMMKALPPVSFPSGPSFVRFHPTMSSVIIGVGQSGQFQQCDVMDPTRNLQFYQLDMHGYCCGFDISSSGQQMCFGDSSGVLHQWSESTLDVPGPANLYARATEMAAPYTLPTHSFDVDDLSVPLNSIGMPYYTEPLLSSTYPTHLTHNVSGKSPLIPSTILNNVKNIDFVGYAPNPAKGVLRRNQSYFVGKILGETETAEDIPKFRSEQQREALFGVRKDMEFDISASTTTSEEEENHQTQQLRKTRKGGATAEVVPKYYKRVEIKYSRFGVEDFDFGFYNKTPYSGLETHIRNSYCNALLQVLRFISPLKQTLKYHSTILVKNQGEGRYGYQVQRCLRDPCLSCELGYLFKMLDAGKGVQCHATNFLRSLSRIPQANALGLLEPEGPHTDLPYPQIIQNMNRFLLERVHQELSWDPASGKNQYGPGSTSNYEGKPSIVNDVFGLDVLSTSKCVCGNTKVRETTPFVAELHYPKQQSASSSAAASSTSNFGKSGGEFGKDPSELSFTDVLMNSLNRSSHTKAWCDNCKRYNHITQTRHVKRLPYVLNINANISGDQAAYFTQTQKSSKPGTSTLGRTADSKTSWVPPRIILRLFEDRMEARDAIDKDQESVAEHETNHEPFEEAEYELTSVVTSITYSDTQPVHLVTHVRVPVHSTEDQATKSEDKWYLFNDFLVRPVAEDGMDEEQAVADVLTFRRWKLPAILQYTRVRSTSPPAPVIEQNKLDPSMLIRDPTNLNKRRDLIPSFINLSSEEASQIRAGNFLCALDAEFVMIHKEEVELRSDGTKSTVRPAQLSLARLSVLRGYGPLEGQAFIDDYIAIREPIIDYLTEFSGIKPGDLRPETSRHVLVPFKSAYAKLRSLVDMGCIFVGHGLSQDFRIMNIVIPKEQVIDTVEIYHIKSRQRKLSLRFLAWCLLKEDIQQETHDSIEDSRMALRLYKLYLDLTAQGVFESVLEDVYAQGRALKWKPPPSNPLVSNSTPVPNDFSSFYGTGSPSRGR